MSKKKKIKPGMLVKAYDEDLRFMGVGLVIKQIDPKTEWDMYQGGDWWVMFSDGQVYVFMGDDLDKLTEKDIN